MTTRPVMSRAGLQPMTPRSSRRRRGSIAAIVGVGLLGSLALSACGQDAPSAPGTRVAEALPSEHVHGISRDPGSGKVNLATHTGLFVLQPDASWKQVSQNVDLMGFAVTGPGTFYASGHPGAGVDLPAPVGLIKSTDAGKTWVVQSLGGQSDFHALTASSAGVMGYDGALKTTSDGKSWASGGLSVEPFCLASSPDGSKVLATTAQGPLSSVDAGRTWVPLTSPPPLVLVAWADSTTAVGLTNDGGVAVSTDAGGTWQTNPVKLANGEAISADRDKAGVLEVLVVTDKGVMQSRDNGASFVPLTA